MTPLERFEAVYRWVVLAEAGYCHRTTADDPGGETYRGIARAYHPDWLGWPVVDAYKRRLSGQPLCHALDADEALRGLVRQFYLAKWSAKPFAELPLEVGTLAFDLEVNAGGVTALQVALNARFQANLRADGVLGPATLAAVLRLLPELRPGLLDRTALERFYHWGSRGHAPANIRGWTRRARTLDTYLKELHDDDL